MIDYEKKYEMCLEDAQKLILQEKIMEDTNMKFVKIGTEMFDELKSLQKDYKVAIGEDQSNLDAIIMNHSLCPNALVYDGSCRNS